MRVNGTGGLTTLTVTGPTVSISTRNLLDYRRLLRRLTAANRTVNDATHAVFGVALTDAALTLRAIKALEPVEKYWFRSLRGRRYLADKRPAILDSITVVKT